MARSGLADRFTLETYYKFAKEYKANYKKEYGKELDCSVAEEITFNRLIKTVNKLEMITNEDGTTSKKVVQAKEPRLVETYELIEMVQVGNNMCDINLAILKTKNYKEEHPDVGDTGAFLDISCDFFKDLDIISGAYKKMKEIRDKYFNAIEEEHNKEKNTDNNTVEENTQ